MAEAEAMARRSRKPGPGTDRLANAARLGSLEKNLGMQIKRYREPGDVGGSEKANENSRQDKDETIVVSRETF